MAYQYQGHYPYNPKVVQTWNSNSMGIYYCGYVLPNGNLCPLYIGQATGEQGIRGRILQHLREDHWPSVTHFGYSICQSIHEAILLESSEISRLQPTYNTQGIYR